VGHAVDVDVEVASLSGVELENGLADNSHANEGAQDHQNGCHQVAKEFARLEQDTCQDYRRCDHYHIECVSEDNGVSPQYGQHWARQSPQHSPNLFSVQWHPRSWWFTTPYEKR